MRIIRPIQFRLIKPMVFLLMISGVLIYFYQNHPATAGTYFLRCPSNFIFGILCPGCGSQRALHHLLHFEIVEAIRCNLLFVLAIPAVLYWLLLHFYSIIFTPKKNSQISMNKYVWIGLCVLFILFGVVRNLPFYPFTFLRP